MHAVRVHRHGPPKVRALENRQSLGKIVFTTGVH